MSSSAVRLPVGAVLTLKSAMVVAPFY